MGNTCYHLVQNLLSSCLLLKNIKTKIYKTTVLPTVLHRSETWTLIPRGEYRCLVVL
jgi:hypothetical protein